MSFKKIDMNIGNAPVPEGTTIKNVRYEINSHHDFNGTIIVDTTIEETRFVKNYDFLNSETLYGRVLITYEDGRTWKSNVISITEDMFGDGVESSIMVYPPMLAIKRYNTSSHYGESVSLEIEGPVFFFGAGTWIATTWIVRDIAGNILMLREHDTDNMYRYDLPLRYYTNQELIIIEASYVFSEPVTTSRSLYPLNIGSGNRTFGIDRYAANALHENNIITLVNPSYEVISYSWYVTNKDGRVLDRGVDLIDILGSTIKDYEYVDLFVTLNTVNHGNVENKFELYVEDKYSGFPVTLPYTTQN